MCIIIKVPSLSRSGSYAEFFFLSVCSLSEKRDAARSVLVENKRAAAGEIPVCCWGEHCEEIGTYIRSTSHGYWSERSSASLEADRTLYRTEKSKLTESYALSVLLRFVTLQLIAITGGLTTWSSKSAAGARGSLSLSLSLSLSRFLIQDYAADTCTGHRR